MAPPKFSRNNVLVACLMLMPLKLYYCWPLQTFQSSAGPENTMDITIIIILVVGGANDINYIIQGIDYHSTTLQTTSVLTKASV